MGSLPLKGSNEYLFSSKSSIEITNAISFTMRSLRVALRLKCISMENWSTE
jgi:hypothetical protein